MLVKTIAPSVMVVVALSVHSLFEGMAIGLEESSSGVWTLMLAISIHAVPIVFCIGTDMISSGLKKVEHFHIMFVLPIATASRKVIMFTCSCFI